MMALAATGGSPHAITHCVGSDLDANRARGLESELRTRPMFAPMHAIVVDEADSITPGGQVRLLQILDRLPMFAVVIFTSNEDEEGFDGRFLTRLKVIHFTNQGLLGPAAAWLVRIAEREGMTLSMAEASKRIRLARNNLRRALIDLDADLAGRVACVAPAPAAP